MSEAPRRILVDTNVWLDYFIPSRRGRSVAIEFLRDACTAQVDLLYAATSLAWDCLDVLSQLATPVPCDLSDIWMASKQRNLHSDYEDDLIIAAAMRSQADLLVTNDVKLCSHAPVAAMSVEDAKNYLATL